MAPPLDLITPWGVQGSRIKGEWEERESEGEGEEGKQARRRGGIVNQLIPKDKTSGDS